MTKKGGEKTQKKHQKHKGEEIKKKSQGSQNTCVSKGLARKAARHPTAHDDQKNGEKNTRKNGQSAKGKKSKKNPRGGQNTCVSKGLARKAARHPTTQDDQKKRENKNPKRPKSFFRNFLGLACGSFLPFGQSQNTSQHPTKAPKLLCHAGPPRFGEEASSHGSLLEWSKGADSRCKLRGIKSHSCPFSSATSPSAHGRVCRSSYEVKYKYVYILE